MPPIAKEFYAEDRLEWRSWLAQNHASAKSVWLVFDKGKDRTLSYDDIVEEALCFGWIDSVPGKVSDTRTKLYISKRKPKSVWSKANKERIEKLTKAGRLMESGRNAVKIAKQNGSWAALDKSDALETPPELEALLAANHDAKLFYEQMTPGSRKIILEWIYAAKTVETKTRRIMSTVERAGQGLKAYPSPKTERKPSPTTARSKGS